MALARRARCRVAHRRPEAGRPPVAAEAQQQTRAVARGRGARLGQQRRGRHAVKAVEPALAVGVRLGAEEGEVRQMREERAKVRAAVAPLREVAEDRKACRRGGGGGGGGGGAGARAHAREQQRRDHEEARETRKARDAWRRHGPPAEWRTLAAYVQTGARLQPLARPVAVPSERGRRSSRDARARRAGTRVVTAARLFSAPRRRSQSRGSFARSLTRRNNQSAALFSSDLRAGDQRRSRRGLCDWTRGPRSPPGPPPQLRHRAARQSLALVRGAAKPPFCEAPLAGRRSAGARPVVAPRGLPPLLQTCAIS